MTPDDRPWPWTQFAIAAGLIPFSFLLWVFGMDAVGDPRPYAPLTLIRTACLYAAPFVGTAGGLWLLVLLVRRFLWPQKVT